MKKNSRLIALLLAASITSTVIPQSYSYADSLDGEVKSAVEEVTVKEKEDQDEIAKIKESSKELVPSQSNEENEEPQEKPMEMKEDSSNENLDNIDNEDYEDGKEYPKNESEERQEDGTDKFNRATDTDRDTFGEDKNVLNLDPSVKEKLEETNGEYGAKEGSYTGVNLKESEEEIKDIVITPGSNETEVGITWFGKGDEKESSVVFNGVEYKAQGSQTTDDAGYYSYKAVITGIKPGDSYDYYVKTGENKSDVYSLRTKALGKNNSFSIAYFGDPQMGSGDSVWEKVGLYKHSQGKVDQDRIDFLKTLKAAKGIDPHFYLSMGDNVESATYEGEYDALLENDFFKTHVFSSVMGNHETYIGAGETNPNNSVFKDHFYLPNESELGSKSEKNSYGGYDKYPGDYWYSYGDTLFLNLNSNNNDSKVHEEFIKKAIADAKSKRGSNYSFIVASFHHSPYSSATHSSDNDILQRRAELVKIFNNNGVDIVLNGHDHIYTRSKHMIAGENTMKFEEAFGTSLDNPSANIVDGHSKTHNATVGKDGDVIVDGIGIDYGKNEVTDPDGTLFLTMSASAGSKFYNPIGEDNWYVSRSLDDRSQLFSILSFDKNNFNVTTMDPYGNVVDNYTIHKTDENIANGKRVKVAKDKSKLEQYIGKVENEKDNVDIESQENFLKALEKAKAVLADETATQEETDAAIKVLKVRAHELGVDVEIPEDQGGDETPENPDENGEDETPENPDENGGDETPENPNEDGEETPEKPDKDNGEDTAGNTDKNDGEQNSEKKDENKQDKNESDEKKESKGSERLKKASDTKENNSDNVKTGVNGIFAPIVALFASIVGLFVTKRK